MKRRLFAPLSLIVLTILLLSVAAAAQDRVGAALDSLPSTQKIDQVAISPDGTKVAYIVAGELSIATISG